MNVQQFEQFRQYHQRQNADANKSGFRFSDKLDGKGTVTFKYYLKQNGTGTPFNITSRDVCVPFTSKTAMNKVLDDLIRDAS